MSILGPMIIRSCHYYLQLGFSPFSIVNGRRPVCNPMWLRGTVSSCRFRINKTCGFFFGSGNSMVNEFKTGIKVKERRAEKKRRNSDDRWLTTSSREHGPQRSGLKKSTAIRRSDERSWQQETPQALPKIVVRPQNRSKKKATRSACILLRSCVLVLHAISR